MSLPSLYPLFMAGSGSSTPATVIEVAALELLAPSSAVTMPVDGNIKLLVIPDDDEVLETDSDGVVLETTSSSTLLET